MIFSLSAENLTCARGQRLLFTGLNFRVEQGQALAIQGVNGVGKTSLLRTIAGFLPPRSGTVRFTTKDKTEISEAEERGKQIGWLGHHDGLKGQLTVAEQLSFFARLYGHGRPSPHAVATNPSQLDAATAVGTLSLPTLAGASRAGEAGLALVLEEVGLIRQSDLPCRYLSAGQKRRLALARLKLTARPIWLLDEPLAALDMAGKHLAANMIAAHCAWGGIVLAATHESLGLPAASLTLEAT